MSELSREFWRGAGRAAFAVVLVMLALVAIVHRFKHAHLTEAEWIIYVVQRLRP
jgi:hypothetical protein